MEAVATDTALAGVFEAEPDRVWFGRGGVVESREDGSFALYVRGELLGVFDAEDVASRDVLIAVVLPLAERDVVARAFRVSPATVGRVVTRFNQGGLRAVADNGRPGGRTIRTPKLMKRLSELFERGAGPRGAHRAVAKLASYGTVQTLHAEWLAERATRGEAPPPPQQTLALEVVAATGEGSAPDTAPAPLDAVPAEPPAAKQERLEPTLEAVAPPAHGVVQHVGTWMLLGLLNELGLYDLATRCAGDAVSSPTLRAAIDATAVALAVGEGCIEGVRRIETPTVGTLLRHEGGFSPSWVRRVLHDFADVDANMFQGAVAARLLSRLGDGDDHVLLYVDNHLRPYSGQEVIRKGWRMQAKRAVPGTTDYYVHDEDGCPLWRVSTPEHESLCAWLKPVADFARLSLGENVKPLLVFDRGGAFPETMANLRDGNAEFVTYERKPYPEIGACDFKETLSITLASRPRQPIRVCYTEAPQKNLRAGRGRVRRIALLTEEGRQINILAVSSLPAEALIRAQLARWGRQENQLKHEVERWGINHLDGRRVVEYPPDALVPNPERRRLERRLKLSHTTEGEAWRKLARLDPGDPRREQFEREIKTAMDRQRDLMALRAAAPVRAKVSETSLAGKLRKHDVGYKNVIDTLRTALANVESDLAVMLAEHLGRPREAKKTLANLFAAPGTVKLGSRAVTVGLMPAGTESERSAFEAFLRDVTRLRLTLPGDPDRRRLRWVLK